VADAEDKIETMPALTEVPDGFRLFRDGKSVKAMSPRTGGGELLPVRFPERAWQEANYDLRYHVFSSEHERTTVPAVSAIDAIAKSGIKDPVRVVRGLMGDEIIAAVVRAGRLVPVDRSAADDAGSDAAETPSESAEAAASGDPADATESPDIGEETEAPPADADADAPEDAASEAQGEPEPADA